MQNPYFEEFDASIMVCDIYGYVVSMNKKCEKTFEKYGGNKLVGKSIIECHPEPAREKLKKMLENQTSNMYTIEKNGVKSIIIQKPWYEFGVYKGFIELSFEMPADIPNFERK